MRSAGARLVPCLSILPFLCVLLGQAEARAMTIDVAGAGAVLVRIGEVRVVGSATVTLAAKTSVADVVALKIGGSDAVFDTGSGTWRADVSFPPGASTVEGQAFNAASTVVDSGTIEIIYLPASGNFTGTLAESTVWSGAAAVEGTLTVPAGVVLSIQAGTVVMLKAGARINVSGQVLAEGTTTAPILFTHYGDGTRWKQIKLIDAADSRFWNCTFEYADSAGDHQDYYVPGPRNYHEAVVLLACHADFEGCIFRRLPDTGSGAEGDALAIIADDQDHPGDASATFRDCRFLGIGQGVHTRFSHVRVEGCYFQNKHGDNDDVDLWGESAPPCEIRNNLFDLPEHDDRINPTRCSAIIVGNTIMGGDDHGLVLRDKGSPIVMNNVIRNCSSAGVAVENSCTATLINNTIVGCGRGLRLFDLGRWDPPYSLNPGGGTATVINCIIWDCPQSMTLADSSNTTIPDRGSHVTVIHCDVEGGRAGVSVSGSQSTVTWGEGNIDADPLFENLAGADFHLKAGSPAIDSGTADQAPAIDRDGVPRPCGAGVDMGAYERCEELPVVFRRADPNSDGEIDISDAITILLHLFAGGREPSCQKSADANDDGQVLINDSIYMLVFLFTAGSPPPAPVEACGVDPTADELSCEAYPPCR